MKVGSSDPFLSVPWIFVDLQFIVLFLFWFVYLFSLSCFVFFFVSVFLQLTIRWRTHLRLVSGFCFYFIFLFQFVREILVWVLRKVGKKGDFVLPIYHLAVPNSTIWLFRWVFKALSNSKTIGFKALSCLSFSSFLSRQTEA